MQLCADADSSLDEWDDDTTTTNNGTEEESIGSNSRSAIGIKAAMSLYELLKGVLAYLNSSLKATESNITSTATTLYECAADEFLKCTSMLYLGQEGTIPKRYGTVSASRLGYPGTSTDRWDPSLSHIFQSLILEAMGQEAKPPSSSSIIWLRLVENESTLHLPSVRTPLCDERRSSNMDLNKEQDCNDDCDDFRKYYS